MASRRLLLSSSLAQRTNFRLCPFPLSCVSPREKREQTTHSCYSSSSSSSHIPSIRSFSVICEDEETKKKRSYRERAREGARKGAKVARKGASTASEMIRQYGPVFVGTYFSIYLFSWAAIFCGIDSGLLDPVQIMSWITTSGDAAAEESKSTVHIIVEYMETYEITKPYAPSVEKNPHFANLAVAWVANKFTEPVRLMATLGIVPSLARHFGFVHPKHDGIATAAAHMEDELTKENTTDKIAAEKKGSESTTKHQ